MNSKKLYIGIGSLVIIFMLLSLYFAFKYEEKYFTVISDPDFKVIYKDNKWTRITGKLNKLETDYDVYDENGYLGNYNLSYLAKANRWYVYNDKMSEVDKIGQIIGIKSNMEYNMIKFTKQEFIDSDIQYIKNILSRNKMDIDTSLANNTLLSVDLNNDKRDDKIIISNLFQNIDKNNNAYSIIVAVIDQEVYNLYYSAKEKDDNYIVMHGNIKSIFDFKKDGNAELIITANSFGQANSCSTIQEITKKGSKLHIKC